MGLFELSAVSTNKRSVATEPIFTVNSGTENTVGGIKLNEVAARLLNIEAGEYLTLVTDYSEVQKAIAQEHEAIMAWAEENDADPKDYPVEWYLVKGWKLKNVDGTVKQVPERLTKAQKAEYEELGGEYVDEEGKAKAKLVDAYKGSKMNSQNGSAGFAILQGSDATNWNALGGSFDFNMEYPIELTSLSLEIDGDVRKLYKLGTPEQKDKMVRG